MSGLSLTMHPGSDGDALSLSWGTPEAPHHAVIDLGRTRDYRALRPWLVATSWIDLLVITHIDADHIEGAMPMVAEPTAPFAVGDVWFNAHDHLITARNRRHEHEVLSVLQGEKLSQGIRRFKWNWNGAFGGGPVSTDSPEACDPIDIGGMTLWLLSPDDATLSALEKDWDEALAEASLRTGDPNAAKVTPEGLETLGVEALGRRPFKTDAAKVTPEGLETLDVEALARSPFKTDAATPNGSSIAFLAEHAGRRVLLAADAHPSVLAVKLRALGYSEQNRLKLDLFKLPHHGSCANLSPELLTLIDTTRFAISTDGTRHNLPDAETIARILKADPVRDKIFYFNFAQKKAALWAADRALAQKWKFSIVTPPQGQQGITIDV